MSIRIGRPPFSDYLIRIFRPSVQLPWPQTLDDGVKYVFPFFHGSMGLEKRIDGADLDVGYFTEVPTGGAGVATVDGFIVPAGFMDVILFADVRQTDAAAHDLYITIRSGTFEVTVTYLAGVAQNANLPALRPFILPAGFQIRWQCVGLGGGATLRGRAVHLRLIPGMDTNLM